jgi:hypothetical protein
VALVALATDDGGAASVAKCCKTAHGGAQTQTQVPGVLTAVPDTGDPRRVARLHPTADPLHRGDRTPLPELTPPKAHAPA